MPAKRESFCRNAAATTRTASARPSDHGRGSAALFLDRRSGAVQRSRRKQKGSPCLWHYTLKSVTPNSVTRDGVTRANREKGSEHFPEGEIETNSAGQGMLSLLERSDTMIDEPRRTAPHNHVAVFDREAAHRFGTALAAPQEHRGKAERNRNNRGPGIVLVAILMETEFGARDIAVDEAGVRIVLFETRFGGRTLGKAEECP